MNRIDNKIKKDIGYKGENIVIDKLKTCGFHLYGKNIKYIDSEIDMVVYKYNENTRFLNIRIVEVKTRKGYCSDLNSLNMSKKWSLIRRRIFSIKSDVVALFDKVKYSDIHFDLALVVYSDKGYRIHEYIEDVNLIL